MECTLSAVVSHLCKVMLTVTPKKDVILSLVFIHFPIYSLLAILLYLLVYCVGAHIFYLYLILVPGAKNTNKKKWKEYQKI
jgi:hypothetical protein